MANTPATPSDKTDDTDKVVIKTASTMNLLQTATIEYEIAEDDSDGIWLRLAKYEGSGYYSKAWISLDKALANLEEFGKQHPITSFALKDVYPANSSINSWGFMMAVLVAEGLVERLEDNKRHFRLCGPQPFLDSLQTLKASQSPPGKAQPRAKTKAAPRMQKGKPKSATGK
jgi:hypothetical protein